MISMALDTWSVVVPGTSETIDTCCPARAFSSEDFPLLRAPASTMWSLPD